jgi:glycosyltransferase involved in cell wall biosynthesis
MLSSSPIDNKLVSVIIPTYNSEKYLAAAIKSVIQQEYINWELIIVDDGSTDNTTALVTEFLTDKRISYIKTVNCGVSAARNQGAELAKGDYFCFLDADDFFYPKNLSKKVESLFNNPTVALVHSDVQMTDETGKITQEINSGLAGNDLHLELLLWKRCVVPAPSSIMVRKDVFYSVGKWDTEFSTAADQDFFIRVAVKHKIERINEILTGYRIVNSSMSRNAASFEKDHLGVFYKAKKNGLFPNASFERKCFANLHLMIAATWWNQNKKTSKILKHLFFAFKYSPLEILNKIRFKLTSKKFKQ